MRGRVLVPKTLVILAIFLSVALFAGTGAWAFIDPGLTLTRLHDEADQAVIGSVERVWVEMGSWPTVAHDVPITHAEILVDEIFKGEIEALITLNFPGGPMPDGTMVRVSGTPEFIEGERIMTFVSRPGNIEHAVVYGWRQGLFPIEEDFFGVDRVLSPYNPNVLDGVTLDEVRAIIRGEVVDDLRFRVKEAYYDVAGDRAVKGCQWCGKHNDGVANLYVNPNFRDSSAGSTSQQVAAIRGGADEWTNRGGACFEFDYKGTSSIDYISLGDGKNVVFSVEEQGWGALAATWCVGSVNNGTDTEFYDKGITFSLDPSWGQMDIQGIACHELGHQIGLGHIYPSSATMYAAAMGTGVSARTIEDEDMDCIQGIYGICGGGTGEYLLDLEASYGSGTLYMDFTIGAPEPCTFTASLILTVPTTQVFELWTITIPAIDPPMFFPVELPVTLDGLGLLYLYSGLHSAQGEEASQLLYGSF